MRMIIGSSCTTAIYSEGENLERKILKKIASGQAGNETTVPCNTVTLFHWVNDVESERGAGGLGSGRPVGT